MRLTSTELDAFVAKSDELGGPGAAACEAYWAGFSYEPTVQVDQGLDPFSEAYVEQQIELYTELSGRPVDQEENEKTVFDITAYVDAPNPYNHPQPSELALHLRRLSKAFHLAGVSHGAHLLDMGSGWGLSSEMGAYLGLKVTAVDINPDFVNLVTARAAKSQTRIVVVQSDFDSYRPSEPVDMILFYECLHHAIRPWTLIETLKQSLTPGGVLVLAGEPINDFWWTHWGMRLDAMSIYCIRKFGWFESGWSLTFITQVIERAGLAVTVTTDSDPAVGYTTVGRLVDRSRRTAEELLSETASEGFIVDGGYGVMSAQGWIDLDFPDGADRAQLEISNFRQSALHLECRVDETVVFSTAMPHGAGSVLIPRTSPTVRVSYAADVWVPADDGVNNDTRTLSLHLSGVSFY